MKPLIACVCHRAALAARWTGSGALRGGHRAVGASVRISKLAHAGHGARAPHQLRRGGVYREKGTHRRHLAPRKPALALGLVTERDYDNGEAGRWLGPDKG
jgi:hypothetical protein